MLCVDNFLYFSSALSLFWIALDIRLFKCVVNYTIFLFFSLLLTEFF
jgi:hypothetical protein